jgi:hypothetical protein
MVMLMQRPERKRAISSGQDLHIARQHHQIGARFFHDGVIAPLARPWFRASRAGDETADRLAYPVASALAGWLETMPATSIASSSIRQR